MDIAKVTASLFPDKSTGKLEYVTIFMSLNYISTADKILKCNYKPVFYSCNRIIKKKHEPAVCITL